MTETRVCIIKVYHDYVMYIGNFKIVYNFRRNIPCHDV